MSNRFAIGIDLGTSTSEITIYRPGRDPYIVPDPLSRSPIVPSLVALDGSDRLLVGCNAQPYIDKKGRGVREVKRLMGTSELVTLGDKELRPQEISAYILRYMKEIAEEYLKALGAENPVIEDAVVSVPAKFRDLQRQATTSAAKLANINVLRLINEPTAAALAYGISEIDAEGQLVVFDFGGGTLDITILEMMEGVLDVKATYGDDLLGGKDFDEAMMSLLTQKFAAQYPSAVLAGSEDLKPKAERAKIELSADAETMVHLPNFGTVDGVPVPLELHVSRAEYETAIEPLLQRARECVKKALKAKATRPSSIDKVILVGGTTYIPAVRQMVAELFPKEPVPSVDPDLAVSVGASIRAAMALDILDADAPIISDVCSTGFGINVVTEIGSQPFLIYKQLIDPNTAVPVTVKERYSLLGPDQRELELSLYESQDGFARFPDEAQEIQGMRITDIPPALYGEPHPVDVEFTYSIDQMITLKASIPGVNKSGEIVARPHAAVMDDAELIAAAERVRDAWRSNPKAARYDALMARAESVMETAGDTERARIGNAIADLKIALSGGADSDIEAAGDGLTDLLFDLEQ